MKEEMESLSKNRTWTLVDLPVGEQSLQNRWVFKYKPEAGATLEDTKQDL